MAGNEAGSEAIGWVDESWPGAKAPPDGLMFDGVPFDSATFENEPAGTALADVDTPAVGYPFEFATEYVDNDVTTGDVDCPGAGDATFGSPIDEFADEAAMVRPYAWTRGRTKANYDLKLETLISTTELGEDETLLPQLEHRAVSSLCRYPLSVAEIAAKLSIPLGVARVILSDMAELGLISIHRTFADDDIAAHLVLMERVLSGLRRL